MYLRYSTPWRSTWGNIRFASLRWFAAAVTVVLCACGGGRASSTGYSVSVNVIGLANVSGLVLQSNGGDDLTIANGGTHAFTTQLTPGQEYNVTILDQPPGHTCTVQNGSGTVTSSNVSVVVVCPWHVGYALRSRACLAISERRLAGVVKQKSKTD